MKKCYKCKLDHDGNHSYCKSCRKQVDFEYNQRRDKSKKYSQVKLRSSVSKQYILDYLNNNPCSLCSEKDPVVLEFHHISNKKYNICEMISNHSLESIKNEIDKCVILCANCHRRVTAKEQNNYKTKIN